VLYQQILLLTSSAAAMILLFDALDQNATRPKHRDACISFDFIFTAVYTII
jgi:hypothetical protein